MPSPRRLVLVSPNYHPRICGVGDNTARLGLELRGRGIEVVVLTRAPAERHPIAPSIPVVPFQGSSPWPLVKRMLRWIRSNGADDVIVQYTPQMLGASRFGSPAVPRLVRALRARGIPVTVLVHELYLPWAARPDLLAAALAQRLQMVSFAGISSRLAVTTGTRASVLERWRRFLPSLPPIRKVPVGAPVEPVPWSGSGGGFRLGTFSTLGVGKRLEVVLDAFDRVVREVSHSELWLLGDLLARRDRHTRAFREAVCRHPAAARIHIPGRQSLVELATALASMDVFLHPMDTGANTRSSTLALALGIGLPVIATRGPETDGTFEDERNVLFTRSLSGEAFAEAIMTLKVNPELAAHLGRGARAFYEGHLTWPRIADALLV